MVKCDSTSRLPSIDSFVLLTQTDTTVGLLSQDVQKLQAIKKRHSNKPFIRVYKNFRTLTEHLRVPNKQKRKVRRARKTTFIVKNLAFRVADDSANSSLLRKSLWNYSTSANESGKNFAREFCEEKADIIIETKVPLHEDDSSALYKINTKRRVRLR